MWDLGARAEPGAAEGAEFEPAASAEWAVSAEMTLPSAERLALILLDSWSLFPVAPVTATRSDPARSTRWSFPTRTADDDEAAAAASFDPDLVLSSSPLPTAAPHLSIVIVSTACDLEDASFSLVAPVARTALPRAISAWTS